MSLLRLTLSADEQNGDGRFSPLASTDKKLISFLLLSVHAEMD